jgi:hypothetical protein
MLRFTKFITLFEHDGRPEEDEGLTLWKMARTGVKQGRGLGLATRRLIGINHPEEHAKSERSQASELRYCAIRSSTRTGTQIEQMTLIQGWPDRQSGTRSEVRGLLPSATIASPQHFLPRGFIDASSFCSRG